jgi:hypothetical protein
MKTTATLTEIRKDGFQKWERSELPKSDRMRYIWLQPFQSIKGAEIGSTATLVFSKGTGGLIGGHHAGWRVTELVA